MSRAVMRQALEALEHYAQFGATVRARGAIEALRSALMEPVVVQEPVAKYSDIVSDGGMDPRNKFDHPPPHRSARR